MSTIETGHVGLNVTNLQNSVDFYTRVLGFQLAGQSAEGEKKYAFLKEGETLVLTLWQQAKEAFRNQSAGLHHLSFMVKDLAQVREIESRVRQEGTTLHHDGIVPHSEGASSGGIFFEDPDGTRLEVFVPSGLEGGCAPSGSEPTCGFF